MVSGRMICPASTNGAPDCKLGADKLCRAKGFQEGKSIIACNLALSLARAGRKVIIIDGYLRRPQVGGYLGLSSGVGLTSVLVGGATAGGVDFAHKLSSKCAWQMFYAGAPSWYYEPDFYPTGDENFATDAAYNGQGYSNPTADALIAATEAPSRMIQSSVPPPVEKSSSLPAINRVSMPSAA